MHPWCSNCRYFIFSTELYSIVHVEHNYFLHSTLDGYFRCFHIWGFLNSAALNTGLDVSVGRTVSPDMHLGVGLPDQRVPLFLVLQGSFLLIFILLITNLHLHQQCRRLLFSLCSLLQGVFVDFLRKSQLTGVS